MNSIHFLPDKIAGLSVRKINLRQLPSVISSSKWQDLLNAKADPKEKVKHGDKTEHNMDDLSPLVQKFLSPV